MKITNRFTGAVIREVDSLRGAKLRGADLWEADLWGADLRGADLRGRWKKMLQRRISKKLGWAE